MLDIQDTRIPDVKLVSLRRHQDSRGFFSETYNCQDWVDAGISVEFVQDNHAYSVDRHTVRGLHYQIEPFPQAKLVRVSRGAIYDVAVDLRKSSPTFGLHIAANISSAEWNCIFVPVGFAHGFCTLEPETEVQYKVSGFYSPEHDRGLLWDDPALGIDWPVSPGEAILSDRDRDHSPLAELKDLFP